MWKQAVLELLCWLFSYSGETQQKSIFEQAVAPGDIRPDIVPLDILRCIVGVTYFGTSEDWKKSATRLVDILILGSRPYHNV